MKRIPINNWLQFKRLVLNYGQLAIGVFVIIKIFTFVFSILFDNIIITDNLNLARKFAEETFNVKVEHERRFNKILNPVKSFMETFWDLTEQYPWLLPVILIAVVLALVGLTALFFGRKSAEAPHLKKTDEVQPDDEMDEIVQVYFI